MDRQRFISEREWIRGQLDILESLCCTPETYTGLYVNYISIKLEGKNLE